MRPPRYNALLLAVSFLLIGSLPVSAQLIVTNLNNSGAGSLRQAVLDAAAGEIIYFDPTLAGGEVLLTGGEIVIDKALDIMGLGPDHMAVVSNTTTAIRVTNGATVTLSNLSIRGVINTNATLMLRNCHLVSFGGTATNVENEANGASATLTLYHSRVTDGGGIVSETVGNGNHTASLFITATTIADLNGRAVSIRANGEHTSSNATINASTIARSTTSLNVGSAGLSISAVGDNSTVNVTINSSTISGNKASLDGGGLGCGAGSEALATVNINHSTITDNEAGATSPLGGNGGGLFVGNRCTVTLENTIVADNRSVGGHDDISGTVVTNGYNLVSTLTGTTGITDGLNGDRVDADPGLFALANLGGPTEVHGLFADSPAFDKGNCTPAFDQRGYSGTGPGSRVVDDAGIPNAPGGNGCDTGAYELGSSPQSGFQVQLNLWLHGAYVAGGSMTNHLPTSGHLPAGQPYNTAPWNYAGAETRTTAANDQTDWVYIELKKNTTGPATRLLAALLRNTDGRTIGGDGLAATVDGLSVYEDFFFVVARHRNSLDVMSAYPVPLTSDIFNNYLIHDFREGGYKAFGTNPMIEAETGVFALWGGDGDKNGMVTAFDFLNVWLPQNGGVPGYHLGDFNLTSDVTAFDFLQVWLLANGQSTQVP